MLREFCEREGKEVTYRKGDQMEREGDPARWFGFVTEGCFKYVTYGISDALHTVLVHKEIVYLCHIALSNLGAKLLIFREKPAMNSVFNLFE